ncbi:hypothetical protein DL767_004291 [Monosporascus sp. MG133]|nr:hypothetical protein DL767_004291 [Monosporascus sp. MG133]
MVKDLPPYHWNHTTLHWEESRLSREYRHRRHPHHDLLGSRILRSPDSEPSWRTYLGVDNLRWPMHHSVHGFAVFPGAGYITMAVEAMKQPQERAKNGSHIAPLLRNLCTRDNRDAGSRAKRKVERSVESLVAQAPTVQDAEKIILEAIRDRISSLTAGDISEISLNSPLVNLGLDSLIAIEIKNRTTSTLQAPTRVGEILDSPNPPALASLVTKRSGLVEKTDNVAAVNGHQPAPEAVTNGQVVNVKSPKKPQSKEGVVTIRDDVQLPKLPLQPLEATIEVFLKLYLILGARRNWKELAKRSPSSSILAVSAGACRPG